MDDKMMALQIQYGIVELSGSGLGWTVSTTDDNGKVVNLTPWFYKLPDEAVDEAYRMMKVDSKPIPTGKRLEK